MHTDHNNKDEIVRKQLISFLQERNAHAAFEDAVANLPYELTGVVPAHLPYSIWQIVEHIRITQWDILEFSKGPHHKSPKWPEGYWPKETKPDNAHAWEKTIAQVKKDNAAFVSMLQDTSIDLYKPFEWGDGQSLLREAILIVDHTSYHTGEIIVIRRMLNAWK